MFLVCLESKKFDSRGVEEIVQWFVHTIAGLGLRIFVIRRVSFFDVGRYDEKSGL